MSDAAILDLPDDPTLLKQMIVQQIKREAAEQIEAMTQRHKAEMDAILRTTSTGFPATPSASIRTQLLLFGLAVARTDGPVDPASDEAKAAEAESGQKLTTRRINHHKHGRRELPAHLPRFEVVHDLSAEQKKCPCCTEDRRCIGCEISEQLEFVSASFKVIKHVRNKYACKPCGEGCEHCDGSPHIEIATKAAQPIEKGLPGPGLLAHVIVSKLGDHLPLYRLEKIYARNGVDIARSTMCAWMLNCGTLVKPLVDLMTRRVKQSKVIHTDDTRVPVQDETVKGKCKSGRIWCFLGDESNPYDVFHYTPDRTRAGPQNFLADYKGHLQADAYGGYDGIYTRGNVVEVACWGGIGHAASSSTRRRPMDEDRRRCWRWSVQLLYAEDRGASQAAHRAPDWRRTRLTR